MQPQIGGCNGGGCRHVDEIGLPACMVDMGRRQPNVDACGKHRARVQHVPEFQTPPETFFCTSSSKVDPKSTLHSMLAYRSRVDMRNDAVAVEADLASGLLLGTNARCAAFLPTPHFDADGQQGNLQARTLRAFEALITPAAAVSQQRRLEGNNHDK